MVPALSTRNQRIEVKPSDHSMTCQVRVCVRVRPITAKEQESGASNTLEVANSKSIQLSGRRFTFDSVFDASTSQNDLYRSVAPSLMQSFLDGYNATVCFRETAQLCIHSTLSHDEVDGFLGNCVRPDWLGKDVYDG